jgi:alkaline phosphatase
LIDHGHHDSNAKRALEEFVVFDEAVKQALMTTDDKDTLIVVTGE